MGSARRRKGSCRSGLGLKASLIPEALVITPSCSEPEDLGLNFTLPPSSCVEMSQAANLSETLFPSGKQEK